MSDNEIAPRVGALLALQEVDPQLVQATVEQGIVYVEGVVSDAPTRQAIEANVRRLEGVRQVINCLAVEHVAQLPHAPHVGTRLSNYRLILSSLVTGGFVPPGTQGISRTTFRDV